MRKPPEIRLRYPGAALAIALLCGTIGEVVGQESSTNGAWDDANWWLRLRSSLYSFETFDLDDGSRQDRLGAYQYYDARANRLANGHLSFRLAGRFADDLRLDRNVYDSSRLHVGYAQAMFGPQRNVRARFGRQFLQEGPNSLALDGGWVRWRATRRVDVRAWAGARSPSSREWEAGEDAAAGLRIVTQALPVLRFAASFAYREVGGQIAARPLGIELNVTPIRDVRGQAKGSYDLEHEEWERVEFLGQWRPDIVTGLIFSGQYLDRRAAVRPDSYFTRFGALDDISVARVTGRYVTSRGFGTEVEYFGSSIGGRSSSRVGLAAILKPLFLGYSVRLGDAGEENRFYGSLRYAPLSWLRLEGGASVSTYTLLEDAPSEDDRDLTTGYLRSIANLRKGLRLTLELQSNENPGFSEDIRFLAAIDLLFSGGPGAPAGLGKGSWLP